MSRIRVDDVGLSGVKLISPIVRSDERGLFVETFNRSDFRDAGLSDDWVQDNTSVSSARHTLRGLHFQAPPQAVAKLVRVVRGSILDVVVDIRVESPEYGSHVAVELTAGFTSLYVPVGFAHGFCTLEPDTEVTYKVTGHWSPDVDKGLAWDDPDLSIDWPSDRPILSSKDSAHPRLGELPDYFRRGVS